MEEKRFTNLKEILTKKTNENIFKVLNNVLCKLSDDEVFWVCAEALKSCEESRADERDFKDSLYNLIEFLDN